MRNAGGERIYFAKHGRASDLASGSSIVLSDGELLVKNRTANASSRVQFATYALSLADVLPQGGEPVARVQGKTTFELLVGCGEACRTGERRGIAREINRRFSDWLYVLAFAVMTAWFGSRSRPNRSTTKFGMVAVMLLGLVLRGSGFVVLAGSADSLMETALVYLLPISAALLPLVLALHDRPTAGTSGRLWRRVFAAIGNFADIVPMSALSQKMVELRHRSLL
jgi:lipopolysaccharide export system permease protein